MTYSAYVNLNDLPWTHPRKYKNCLGEVERLALDTEGFIEGTTIARLLSGGVDYYHFIACFDGLEHAQEYQTKLFQKEYIGRVAIQRDESSRVMERAPPKELLKRFAERTGPLHTRFK